MANLRADNLTGTGGRNAIDGSVFFNGTEDSLGIPSIALGSGDWTIEFWFYSTKEGSQDGHIYDGRGTGSASSAYPIIKFDTDEKLSFYTTGAIRIQGSSVVELGSWNHVALVKNSSTTTLYLNGQSEGTYSDSNTYIAPSNSIGRIGSDDNGSGYFFYGYLSNFRFVTGTAVYTAAFTPPTEKLTAVDGTVLLCCQDSDNPVQEATGKTITAAGGLDINETEYVTNGTFGGSGTSPGGSTYSPAWTAWGDTTTAQSGGVFIERTSTLTGVYQLLTGSSIPAGQYRIRGTISNKTGPGSAIIRLSSAAFGNGTIFFGSYGPGVVESTVNYSGTGNLYLNLMLGNNTGSADFSNISFRQVYTAGGSPKVLPPVGVDEGVTFEGETKHNTQGVMYFPTGTTKERGGYSGRMIVGGGEVNASPGTTNVIEYLNFAHFSNAVDFGDLTQARRKLSSCSSSTRGIWAGGGSPGSTDVIDYVTIATTGNAADFGNLFTGVSDDSSQCFGGSNNTRGIFAGGYNNVNTIQYITIATTADAQDFGDLISGRFDHAGFASPTRVIFAGGKITPTGNYNSIEYVTIATTGNGTDFGDMTAAVRGPAGLSNNIRGLMGGGTTPTLLNNIEYVTIASTGNAADFGDLHQTRQETLAGGTSNNTRGCWAGGQAPAYTTKVDMVMIATTGNAIDFGNLTTGTSGAGSVSDSHGGLS